MSNRTVLVLVALLAFALVGGAIAIIVIAERDPGEEVYAAETAGESVEQEEVSFEDTPQPAPQRNGYNSRAQVEFDQAEIITEARKGSVQQAIKPVNTVRDAVNRTNSRSSEGE